MKIKEEISFLINENLRLTAVLETASNEACGPVAQLCWREIIADGGRERVRLKGDLWRVFEC